MASIANDPGGRKRILFVNPDGDRKAIRLGKVSQRSAEGVKYRIEQLLEAILLGRPMEADLAQWVIDLKPPMAKKLAGVGLISSPEATEAVDLEEFIESYISRRNDVSPHTQRIWRQTKRLLVAHFGKNKPLDEITRGDAADWRLSLIADKKADASVRKHCGFAKHFFAQAVEHELIAVNPFGKLVSAPVGNASRQYFVTREETAQVIAAATDAEWRLLIALSRYGGLRCPSEHLALRWADIDWQRNRILVHSPKTAKHAGHESRIVPLFAELRPYLEAVRATAGPESEFVITRYRDPNTNLRTQIERIVRRAGLKPWPRITHNLRASRATELAAEFPAHVAAAWLGHSTLVAQKHYWQLTEADYERAARGSNSKSGAENGAQEAQKAAQQEHSGNRGDSQTQTENPGENASYAKRDDTSRNAAKKMAEVHGNRTHLSRGSRAIQRF